MQPSLDTMRAQIHVLEDVAKMSDRGCGSGWRLASHGLLRRAQKDLDAVPFAWVARAPEGATI